MSARLKIQGVDYGRGSLSSAKKPRPAGSYRGARRNIYFALKKMNEKNGEPSVTFREYCHTLWPKGEWCIAPLMNMIRTHRVIGAPHPRSPQSRYARIPAVPIGGVY